MLCVVGVSDANARDSRKRTPLMWAVRNNQLAVVNALLADKAKFKRKSKFSFSCYHSLNSLRF